MSRDILLVFFLLLLVVGDYGSADFCGL